VLSREKILNSVIEVFEKALPEYSYDLFVFGSQANKKVILASDIDLGVRAKKPIDRGTLLTIEHELNDNLPSLYTFDIVDFMSVESSFEKVALENIELLTHDNSNS